MEVSILYTIVKLKTIPWMRSAIVLSIKNSLFHIAKCFGMPSDHAKYNIEMNEVVSLL